MLRRGASGGGSTGLGLDIVARAAARSGGAVRLGQSASGGAEVTVDFGPPLPHIVRSHRDDRRAADLPGPLAGPLAARWRRVTSPRWVILGGGPRSSRRSRHCGRRRRRRCPLSTVAPVVCRVVAVESFASHRRDRPRVRRPGRPRSPVCRGRHVCLQWTRRLLCWGGPDRRWRHRPDRSTTVAGGRIGGLDSGRGRGAGPAASSVALASAIPPTTEPPMITMPATIPIMSRV